MDRDTRCSIFYPDTLNVFQRPGQPFSTDEKHLVAFLDIGTSGILVILFQRIEKVCNGQPH